jgi:predicted alpha/beta-hydrolase family hydrolase
VVEIGPDKVTARLDPTDMDEAASAFVFAHGAGGHMTDRGMEALTSQLLRRGLGVVRFNFPYRERRGKRPDPMPVLQDCIAAVVASARERIDAKRWIVGGRSMGGRAASMLVAEGFACDALLLLAYPLHPAGEPTRLRAAHLASIARPALCLNGTRDALCHRDLMDKVVAGLRGSFAMHWIEGADHSFHVLKFSGRTDADVLDEVGNATEQWLSGWDGSTA